MNDKLYEMMRFQVMAAALQPGSRDRLNNAFVYAISAGVYPSGHSSHVAEPFAESFDYPASKVEGLAKLLDDRWISKEYLTFYELENLYDGREDRAFLVSTCRYFFLMGYFDSMFWDKLFEPAEFPIEADCVRLPFDRDDEIFFS